MANHSQAQPDFEFMKRNPEIIAWARGSDGRIYYYDFI